MIVCWNVQRLIICVSFCMIYVVCWLKTFPIKLWKINFHFHVFLFASELHKKAPKMGAFQKRKGCALQWRMKGGRPWRAPPLFTKIFLISCSFWGKYGKFVCWRPHLKGWHPLLRGILDPPLHWSLKCNATRKTVRYCTPLPKKKISKTWTMTVADQGGARNSPPVQILLFSCSFQQKNFNIIGLGGWPSPFLGNPGSATV